MFGNCYEVLEDSSIDSVVIDKNKIIVKSQKELNIYLDSLIKDVFYERLIYWYDRFEELIPKPNLVIRRMKSSSDI